MSWVVLRPDDSGRPDEFDWVRVHELLAAYEDGAKVSLQRRERAAMAPYLAAVPLYMACVAGFTPDPDATLRGEEPFLRIAEWTLANHHELVDILART